MPGFINELLKQPAPTHKLQYACLKIHIVIRDKMEE